MLFSKTVAAQRQSAWLKFLNAPRSDRPTVRPIFTRYMAALHAAEEVFLEATEDEREAAVAAQTAAHDVFQTTVNKGSEQHETSLDTLPETDVVARKEATDAFHNILRSANSVYERAVGPTALVLKVIEARAMIAFEAAARDAFAAFNDEMKAALIEPTENRSSCHAGCDRFILQKEGGKR
ncbi:MAG: hypothetical protein P4L53_06350 [Candidatus Obscuribacterales bacterium]|nr:hypothetical protein [Candidatus Obscuribacterales bacterium]